ncbi:MAG TPA: cation-translocating P-type ATPase [Nitrospira sp.]|nr:cation-translocating P-type ATPase [Nitrospira sp.]
MTQMIETPSWHALSPDDVAQALATDVIAGLGDEEAVQRLLREGFNELPESPPPSIVKLFVSQFASVIIWVLLGAAAVSGLLEDWLDAAAIMAIVLLNGVLGFVQEYRAERTLAALRNMSVPTTRVVRHGTVKSIPARDVVPGDLLVLEAGDRIPADARLIYTASLQTQEASLTGESTPVLKDAHAALPATAPLANRMNMVFMGTVAVSGKSRAVVVGTGPKTQLGRIAGMIQQATEAEQVETPLQRRLEQFGYRLIWLALGVVAMVFGLGYWRGEPLLGMFLTSVSLAVAAVPEGLPAVVTITLALGVTRMAKRHALIRRLPAVETLGSATVICTDKTGTLTKNEMTVTKLYAGDAAFDTNGETARLSSQAPGIEHLLTAVVLCNGAALSAERGAWQVIGDPTEGALLVFAARLGMTKARLEQRAPFEDEIPFDAERKMMTVIRRTPAGSMAYVKGAPDVVVPRCTRRMTLDGAVEILSERHREHILATNRSLAGQALRILAVAHRPLDQPREGSRAATVEQELVFLGLIAMKDPVRPEAVHAVRLCREAGITTVMITGDHKDTAAAIARELGLLDGEGSALSADEIDGLTDDQLAETVQNVSVFARVSAEHKLRIVRAWKRRGAIVAMTGDGVNDAPAIKAADIGVAMGITGTDVTKEAADMVVTDDNFASIAAAVEEGRAVFENIRKTVHFLLSCNFSEVLVMLYSVLMGLPLPLLPIHILWMNLVTDGIPALALAVDPKAPDLMKRRPRRPDAQLLGGKRLVAIGVEGLMLSVIVLGTFVYSLYGWQQTVEEARTVAFTVMVVAQLVHAFNCRSERLSLFQVGLLTNRALLWAVLLSLAMQLAVLSLLPARPIFKVAPLPIENWELMAAMVVLPLILVEAAKWIKRH